MGQITIYLDDPTAKRVRTAASAGRTPGSAWIAGTALARKAVLVTRNVREFGRVEGLRVENWY